MRVINFVALSLLNQLRGQNKGGGERANGGLDGGGHGGGGKGSRTLVLNKLISSTGPRPFVIKLLIKLTLAGLSVSEARQRVGLVRVSK